MICWLDAHAGLVADGAQGVRRNAEPALVAALNSVPPQMLQAVPDLRCYLTADGGSGLVVQDVEDDVVVSFVATRPSDRGRGSATRLVRAALVDARDRGAVAAVLQATPLAERLYQRLGFVPVGTWQEWLPA